MKVLLKVLINKVEAIHILDYTEKVEEWGDFNRKVGFEQIRVKFDALK